mgnify:CR=1 FL=1
MDAVVLHEHGGPEVLRHERVPRPEPGFVLIRVLAAGINNTDINTRIGWYSPSVRGDTATAEAKPAPEAAAQSAAGKITAKVEEKPRMSILIADVKDIYLANQTDADVYFKLPESFIRVHKSFIVTIPKIKSFSSVSIELDNIEIPISRTYKSSTLAALNFNKDI